MKNKLTAVILALLFGTFGAHRFYLGQPKLGVLYILFVWTLIPAILSLIDVIVLLATPTSKFNQKYNKMETSISPAPEFSVDISPSAILGIEEGELEAYAKKRIKERNREIRAFYYDPADIKRKIFMLIESLSILDSTKNFDTLKGRYDHITSFYDDLVKASHHKRYFSDAQDSIDRYKLMYYDKIISESYLSLTIHPNHKNLDSFYCECLYNSFIRFKDLQYLEIENLKRPDAKNRRLDKIIETSDLYVDEISICGSDHENQENFISIIDSERDRAYELRHKQPKQLQ